MNGVSTHSHSNPGGERIAPARKPVSLTLDPDLVFSALSTHRFADAARALGVPTGDLWRWIRSDSDRLQAFEAAQEVRAHLQVDEADEISQAVVEGDLDPNRAATRIKFIQWRAGKTKPYADKQSIEHSGSISHTIKLDDGELLARLDTLAGAVKRQPVTIDHDTITASDA